MTLAAEVQQLATTDYVVLYEVWLGDIAPDLAGDNRYLRFTNQTNGLGQPIVWGGKTFTPYPIEAEGFDLTARGSPPRPKLRAANIDGVLSELCLAYQDLIQAKITRIRTFSRFLDAINFTGGNPNADPGEHYPLETYYIERRSDETNLFIEWELRWPFDLSGQKIPARAIVENICPWQYKSTECGWVPVVGKYFNNLDQPCAVDADDCSQQLSGCQRRFGAKSVLPYGGFPAVGVVRR